MRQTGRVFGRKGKSAERERLLVGRSNFGVFVSRSQVAASLWDYGEDELAERALQMSDQDLLDVQAIASHFEDPRYPLPVPGQQITHNHVTALAAVMFYEGELRPLARTRRRAQKNRPVQLETRPPDPTAGL
jgi:hypothetical protein